MRRKVRDLLNPEARNAKGGPVPNDGGDNFDNVKVSGRPGKGDNVTFRDNRDNVTVKGGAIKLLTM